MSGKKNGFFKEERTDLTISNPNFLENTLCCMNQGSISPIKGEQTIYLEFVIIGQISLFANPDPKIDFKDNEVLLFVPSYNTETGLYQGLKKKLGYIMLRGDVNERFFSYGYQKEKSKALYCTVKQPIQIFFIVLHLKNIWVI